MKKMMTLAALAVVALSSCNKENNAETTDGKVALQLKANAASVVTKAGTVIPLNGYNVGVYASQSDPESAVVADKAKNTLYTSAGGVLTSADKTLMALGQNYNIYAYAPHKTTVADATQIAFTHGEDLLWAPVVTITNVQVNNHSAQLAFSHLTAQVKFNVVIDPAFDFNGQGTPDPNDAKIKADTRIEVSGFSPTAALNLTSGVCTPAAADLTNKINATAVETPIGSGNYTLDTGAPVCFFIPAGTTTKQPITVKVTHMGLDFIGVIDRVWTAGESYTYTVTVTKSSEVAILDLTGTVVDWVPVTGSLIVQ